MDQTSITLQVACERLITSYVVENWWPAESRFEVLIGAVLVQNTRWTNVVKAIARLRKRQCLDPKKLSLIKQSELQVLIRPAGCQSVKARRLASVAAWVVSSGGLEVLDKLSTPMLRSALLKVHGIGEETADAILCFAFARSTFIADKYARIWLSRMGFVSDREMRSYSTCRTRVELALMDTDLCGQDLHAAIVMHAQSVCRREPSCCKCALMAMCSHGSTPFFGKSTGLHEAVRMTPRSE